MKNRKKYFFIYTIGFMITTALVFGVFFVNGRTLIHKEDGWVQHFRALTWYSQWLREIVRTLLHSHRLVIPQWSFSMGYGSDIITTMSYYVLGDPLNLFSVLVPVRYMAYFYSFLMIFRIYLAGITFSVYCMYRGNKNPHAVLAGALAYAFCGYALFGAIRHPFFLNPMIYFPMILTGVEMVRDRKNPILMILSVALAAASNFYFFYMLVIFTVLYVLVRAVSCYGRREIKKGVLWIARIGGYSIVGVLISAFLFLPTVAGFFEDQRVGAAYVFDRWYGVDYYHQFLRGQLTYLHLGSWSYGGYAVLVLLAVFLLFLKKGRPALKVSLLFCTGLLLVPAAGYFLNGGAYVSNRWVWVYAFLAAYILTEVWEELLSLKKWEYLGLVLFTAVYFGADAWLNQKSLENMTFAAWTAAALLALAAWRVLRKGTE